MRDKSRKEQRAHKRRISDALILILFIAFFAGVGYFVFIAPSTTTHDETTITRAKLGDIAPSFRLPTVDGRYVSLSDYRGYPVLIFFNEGIGCDPCWRQIVELQNSQELAVMKVSIIAVTVDPVDQLQPIIKQWGIKVPVASDTSLKTVKDYDALYAGSMHPGQRPGHTFILVSADGIIKWRYDLPQAQANAGNMYVPTQDVIQYIRKALVGG